MYFMCTEDIPWKKTEHAFAVPGALQAKGTVLICAMRCLFCFLSCFLYKALLQTYSLAGHQASWVRAGACSRAVVRAGQAATGAGGFARSAVWGLAVLGSGECPTERVLFVIRSLK